MNSAGEFDAWKYIPEGDVVKVADFDWRPYRRWCAVDEYWDGAACKYCPGVTTSRGGVTTVCCAADEYADGSACVTCPAGSTSLKYVMCICDVNEYWDGTSCAACTEGSFSAGGNATTTSCTTYAATEYWNSDGCRTCPTGSTGTGDGTLCACDVNEYWDGIVRGVYRRLVQCGRQCDHHIVHDLRRYGILEQRWMRTCPTGSTGRDALVLTSTSTGTDRLARYAHWARSVGDAT